MSWGDGQYFDYCYKISDEINKRKIGIDKLVIFLNKKWKYVQRNANLDKDQFFEDIYYLLKRDSE